MLRRGRWLYTLLVACSLWPIARAQPAASHGASHAAARHMHHADHAAALADCHGHWGRELGPLLCPAMFADEDGDGSQANVEVQLLGALWHIAGRKSAAWWRQGSQVAGALWTEVRALQGGDDAP